MNKIKLLVLDVDGTMTDGKIYISPSGEAFKAFSVKDGYAIANILPKIDVLPVIITGRTSKIVEFRAKELNIAEVHQGVDNKLLMLEKLLKKYDITYENVAYIGDDLNDLICIEKCGFTGCPSDAVQEVKKQVGYICDHAGGEGAVREFIEYLEEQIGR